MLGQFPQLKSIQYIRACAALLVVYQHTREMIPAYLEYLYHLDGEMGVDIFFVISGFIMAVATRTEKPLGFMARRIIRIVPLYWLFTFVTVVLLALAPQLVGNIQVTPEVLFQSLLFIPHEKLTPPHFIAPVLVPGWTLSYEMLFYILLAALSGFGPTRRMVMVTAVFGVCVVAGVAFGPMNNPGLAVATSPLLLEFAGGMGIGYLYLRGRLPGLAVSATAGIIGVVALLFSAYATGPRLLMLGFPAFLLVLAAVTLEVRGKIPVIASWRYLGDASYSIYLGQITYLCAWRLVWRDAGFLEGEGSLLMATAFALSSLGFAALAGSAVYWGVERPLLRYLRDVMGRAPPWQNL